MKVILWIVAVYAVICVVAYFGNRRYMYFPDPVPSENLIRRIRSRKENRIMIETDGDLLRTSAWIYAGLLSFA